MNAARVLSKGFEVGDLVERKVDGKRGKITEITADHVRFVAEDSSDEFQVSSESFVRGEWKKVAAKKVVTMLTQWHLSAGTNSREFEISILKAKVLQAMADQHEHLAVNYNAVDICKQPRDVKSNQDFAVRELQLPITSCKIHVVKRPMPRHLLPSQLALVRSKAAACGWTSMDSPCGRRKVTMQVAF